MNDQQLLRWHDGLVKLTDRHRLMHVTYLHDDYCPCAKGNGAALPDCICDPFAEVDGVTYMMDSTGKLRVMERPLPK